MTTETTSQLPPCPLPDCASTGHHYHDVETYAAEIDKEHDCVSTEEFGYRCYGPSIPQWQPIEYDQIRAGMRIRVTSPRGDRMTTHVGVAHHQAGSCWHTEDSWPLAGWGSPTIFEVDPATIPDPDAELIDALRGASWLTEDSGERPDPLPGLPEARDLLNKLRELGRTVIRESEATA